MDFRELLVACWCLDDEDRRDALRWEERALQSAYYTNFAFAAPKQLEAADRRFRARLAVPADGLLAADPAIQDARAQLRDAGRIG